MNNNKIPDVMIVRIPTFRAVTSGLLPFNELFEVFGSWQEANNHLFKPIIFDGCDFLTGVDDKMEWFWRVHDDVTETDVTPYTLTTLTGGLYAVATCIDGDGESHQQVREKMFTWLESSDFVLDSTRREAGHMIYVEDDIQEGLGYNQLNLYLPISRLK